MSGVERGNFLETQESFRVFQTDRRAEKRPLGKAPTLLQRLRQRFRAVKTRIHGYTGDPSGL